MGSIGWFARNGVAANLLMAVIIGGGVIAIAGLPLPMLPAELRKPAIVQEVFPEFSLDMITITVPYLGAAPEEVEEGVCQRIEEAIQGLDGIKKLTSVANEGVGLVTVQLQLGADSRKVLDDVKSRIDAIDTFPAEAEEAVVRELTNRRQVISVAVWGDADEKTLRTLAEQVRDDLTTLPEITVVELANARPYEISVEVAESALRRHGIDFDFVANAVRRSSFDLPGGSLKTAGGEILLRAKGQAYTGRDFEDLVLLTHPDGSHLRLGEVAEVVDGFEDTDQSNRFNGKPAVLVDVFRVGDQDALSIVDAVKGYIEQAAAALPAGVELETWQNAAQILRQRRDLLVRNGVTGLALVFLSLALFLRFRLAFWVALGLALAFLGSILMMPVLGVSINMISLFAFILVLGIVVDDAIIVGENIYSTQHRTGKGLEGAIEGAREVSTPVIFAVLTTVAAFTPLLSVAGTTGKIMRVIPLIVIPCLLWSLVESLWILPFHLSHYRHVKPERSHRGLSGLWHKVQGGVADGLQLFIRRVYTPSLELALQYRYVTAAIGLATLLLVAGAVGRGWVRFVFFPDVESDYVSAAVTMTPGTPVERTTETALLLEEAAEKIRADLFEEYGKDQFRYYISAVGEHPFSRAQRQNAGGGQTRELASNLGELTIELLPAEERQVGSAEIAERWRDATGNLPDTLELNFSSSLFEPGEDINVQLAGSDLAGLQAVANGLKERLASYTGVYEIADSFRPGKREVKLRIKPQAEVLGLTQADLGRQVRQAFYGEEAQRVQRNRDELRVMVRYPADERRSLGNLEQMRIRTPDGREVPFSEVAVAEVGRGYSNITRVDRQRVINVTADVDPAQASPGEILADVRTSILPELLADHPRITYSLEGQQAEQRDTLGGLFRGFAIALLAILALLAVPLRSYLQPLLIVSAVPFGFVGAVLGHVLMGMPLTILSMFGLVALTGVVVNDSLVMVDFINRFRNKGGRIEDAIRQAGIARFRPILLTSLTTFLGLSPLLLERSMQARFLIPMAISLAFGVIFATFITLILIPSGYLILEDLSGGVRRLFSRMRKPVPAAASPEGAETGAAAIRR